MYIKEQNFLVLGLSKSGYAVAKYILENGGKCYLFEELSSPKIDKAIKDLVSLGGIVLENEKVEKMLLHIDVLVISLRLPCTTGDNELLLNEMTSAWHS